MQRPPRLTKENGMTHADAAAATEYVPAYAIPTVALIFLDS